MGDKAGKGKDGKGKGGKFTGKCWGCGEEGHRMGAPTRKRPGAGLARPKMAPRQAHQAE